MKIFKRILRFTFHMFLAFSGPVGWAFLWMIGEAEEKKELDAKLRDMQESKL